MTVTPMKRAETPATPLAFRVDYAADVAKSATFHETEAGARAEAEAYIVAGGSNTERTAVVSEALATYHLERKITSVERKPAQQAPTHIHIGDVQLPPIPTPAELTARHKHAVSCPVYDGEPLKECSCPAGRT